MPRRWEEEQGGWRPNALGSFSSLVFLLIFSGPGVGIFPTLPENREKKEGWLTCRSADLCTYGCDKRHCPCGSTTIILLFIEEETEVWSSSSPPQPTLCPIESETFQKAQEGALRRVRLSFPGF